MCCGVCEQDVCGRDEGSSRKEEEAIDGAGHARARSGFENGARRRYSLNARCAHTFTRRSFGRPTDDEKILDKEYFAFRFCSTLLRSLEARLVPLLHTTKV